MTNSRVNEIDMLRFVAALSVVFFHYSFRGYAADSMSIMPYSPLAPFSKYGYLGVELFFMISGFVILMTAATGSLRRFVTSRISRLYPAFWACCSVTFLVTLAIGEPRYSASIRQYLINMTMLSGFLGVPSIDGVYWSLFVEIRFYALVALVLILGKIDKAQPILLLWLLASAILEAFPVPKLRFLLIVDYAAFFIAGATYFLIWKHGITAIRFTLVAASWFLGSFQAITNLPSFEEHYGTEMNPYAVIGIVSIFHIAMTLVSLRLTGLFGRMQWVLAGAVTYPLYLLHQNIGFMVFNLAYPAVNPHVLLWGLIALCLVAAFAVHALIEKRLSPLIKPLVHILFDQAQRIKSRSIDRISARSSIQS